MAETENAASGRLEYYGDESGGRAVRLWGDAKQNVRALRIITNFEGGNQNVGSIFVYL